MNIKTGPIGLKRVAGMKHLWPEVEIRSTTGVPTIFIKDEPSFTWTAHRPFLPGHVEAYQRLYGAGLSHVQIDATCAEDIYHPELRFWTKPNCFDGSAQDEYFRRVTSVAPDALIQLRIYCGCPDWWIKANPEEAQIYGDGSRERDFQRCSSRAVPSLASLKWQDAINEALRRYILWLMESGWSRRVSMLFLGNGITWEWALLGTDGMPDYSPQAVEFFRQWLRKKYGNDDALSAAWGRPATLQQAQIPAAERRATEFGAHGVRPLPDYQDVVDHQQSISDMNASFLLRLAETARKTAGAGGPLIGCFYGYTLTAREQSTFTGRYGAGGFTGGHHAFERVLQSESIDVIASPFNYANRRPETGVLLEHVALRSVHAHNKAFFDENDNYTFDGRPEDERDGTVDIGISHSHEEDRTFLHWAWASALVRGKHQWFTELCGWVGPFRENFSNPDYLAEVARLNAIAESCMHLNRTPKVEVAFVLDELAIAYLSFDNTAFRERIYRPHPGWLRHGAPVDFILSEDLQGPTPPRYKLLIPAGPATVAGRAAIMEYLARHPACLCGNKPGEFPPEAFDQKLAELMEQAGVHIYMEGNACVWASEDLITIQTPERGVHSLRFPRRGKVRELLSGDVFDIQAQKIRRSFQDWGVQVFSYLKQ